MLKSKIPIGLTEQIEALERNMHGYSKSLKESEVCRKKGNNYFCQKDSWKALEIYSQSVLLASRRSEGLALAYGNRSAALFELGYHEECLRDINRCLNTGQFPEASSYKLHTRRLKCLAKLCQNNKLKTDVDKLTDYLWKTDIIKSEKKNKVLEEAECLLNKRHEAWRMAKRPFRKLPTVLIGSNEHIPALSITVKLDFTPHQGRFLTTMQRVQPGSVLIVEKPYASVLLPHAYDAYCHNCHKLLPLDLVPCENCSQVRFCSETCRDNAWERYHWLECGSLELLHQVGIGHLALRIILVTELADLMNYFSCEHIALRSREGHFGTMRDELYMASDYTAIFNLVSHQDQLCEEDIGNYEMTAVLLSDCLSRKNFIERFDQIKETPQNVCDTCKRDRPWREMFKECLQLLLLRHIQQLICNAHAITAVVNTTSKLYPWHADSVAMGIDTTDQIRIASAVYPSASLMNHACDPNVFSSFVGNTLVVRAVKNIPLGAEVLNCYGPHVGRMLRAQRIDNLLHQYHFTCRCLTCGDTSNREQTLNAFRCNACEGAVILRPTKDEGECMDCQKSQPCLAGEVEAVIDKLMENNDGSNAKTVHYAVTKLDQVLYKHNKRLSAARDHVARLLAEAGLFAESENVLLRNLETVRYYYGVNTVEVGNELQKMIDVQVAALEQSLPDGKNIDSLLKKLQKNIDSAVDVFGVYYGTDCSQIEELSRLKQALGFSSTV